MTYARLHIHGVGIVDVRLNAAGDGALILQRLRDAGYKVTLTL